MYLYNVNVNKFCITSLTCKTSLNGKMKLILVFFIRIRLSDPVKNWPDLQPNSGVKNVKVKNLNIYEKLNKNEKYRNLPKF